MANTKAPFSMGMGQGGWRQNLHFLDCSCLANLVDRMFVLCLLSLLSRMQGH